MQNVHTTSVELTYNHSRLQTCTYLHKLWLSALKGGHIPIAQFWSKLAQGKLNRKDKAEKERVREQGCESERKKTLRQKERIRGRRGWNRGATHTEVFQILEIMRQV